MEEKLELRHLAPYLPYKLKMMHYNKEKVLNAGQGSSCNWVGITHAIHHQDKTKPLLYPLDRLTEPILEGGETPIDWLQEKYYTLNLDAQCKRVLEDERWINQCDWLLIQHFAEWHIDFQGLIEKGLALPIDPK